MPANMGRFHGGRLVAPLKKLGQHGARLEIYRKGPIVTACRVNPYSLSYCRYVVVTDIV